MAWLQDWAYTLSDEGIWAHLYGGNVLECDWRGQPVKLVQETQYPWDGEITFTLEQAPTDTMALKLRIPGWCQEASLSVNGQAVEATPGSYATIQRTWQNGDIVTLSLPMPVTLVQANPLIEETCNQLAVMRGPVVYCVEQCDVPDGVALCEVVLPIDAEMSVAFDADLLGGVVAITAQAARRPAPDWQGGLYAPASSAPDEPISVRLIPYYAWWNRGNQPMTIWLPRA